MAFANAIEALYVLSDLLRNNKGKEKSMGNGFKEILGSPSRLGTSSKQRKKGKGKEADEETIRACYAKLKAIGISSLPSKKVGDCMEDSLFS